MIHQHILIGSTALKHWFPDAREPKDIDFLSPKTIETTHLCVRVENYWHEAAEYLIDKSINKTWLDPELLLSLKMSHFHWDIHWEKTKFDILFLKSKGVEYDKEAYRLLLPIWTKLHGEKKVNLNVSKSAFFTEHVKRQTEHDKLHELVKFTDRPWYEKLLQTSDKVLLSSDKFEALTEEEKLQTALEELLVIAIERARLESTSKNSEIMRAINFSYKLLVTRLTKGWFAEYLVDNIDKILIKGKDICTYKIKQTLLNL